MCIYIKKNIRCGSVVDIEVGQVENPVDQAAQAQEQEPDEDEGVEDPEVS